MILSLKNAAPPIAKTKIIMSKIKKKFLKSIDAVLKLVYIFLKVDRLISALNILNAIKSAIDINLLNGLPVPESMATTIQYIVTDTIVTTKSKMLPKLRKNLVAP